MPASFGCARAILVSTLCLSWSAVTSMRSSSSISSSILVSAMRLLSSAISSMRSSPRAPLLLDGLDARGGRAAGEARGEADRALQDGAPGIFDDAQLSRLAGRAAVVGDCLLY